jgi:serine/threonine protein kinase
MGIVYKARDPQIGRLVAVKVLAPAGGLQADEVRERRNRFQREARAAGRLAHPNIVTVHDVGEDQDRVFLVMELLQGESLEQHLRKRRALPLEEALPILDQVASALDYAHEHGIIHRDVKPANILLTPKGIVKVADFGIAVMMGGSLIQTGHILGTPSYMSPEQVAGLAVDGRSDIFSLGAVLYEVLSGDRAFPGETISAIIYRIVHEDPIPLRRLNPAFPEAMDACLRRTLAKDPAARYPRASDMTGALRAVDPSQCSTPGPAATVWLPTATPRRTPPSQPGPGRRSWVWIGLAALAGIALAVGLRASYQKPPHFRAASTPPSVAAPSAPAAESQQAIGAGRLEAERGQVTEERTRPEKQPAALEPERRSLEKGRRSGGSKSPQSVEGARSAAPDVIRQFVFAGNTVISSQELDVLLRDAVGRPGTSEELQGAADLVTKHYRSRGYFLARARSFSPQVRDGIATIQVEEGRIGRLRVGPALQPDAQRVEAAFAPAMRQGILERAALGAAIRSLALQYGLTIGLRIQAGEAPGTFDLLVHRSRSGRMEIELPGEFPGGSRRLQFPLGSG